MDLDHSRFYRRNLPHIIRNDRPLFITFSSLNRWRLPPGARTIALRHALFDHGRKFFMHVAVIMPDHVHLIMRLHHESKLDQIIKGIKGVSARRINQLLHRNAFVWRDESLDHVVRTHECTRQKIDYVCNNPVRAGLVVRADEYPWLWRSWREGGDGAWITSLPW